MKSNIQVVSKIEIKPEHDSKKSSKIPTPDDPGNKDGIPDEVNNIGRSVLNPTSSVIFRNNIVSLIDHYNQLNSKRDELN